MVSDGLSVCLVLQTPSHLAGPPAVPGSMPAMQGMGLPTIRKFPAPDRTKSPVTTGARTITGGRNERNDEWDGGGGTRCPDRHGSRYDPKTINTLTEAILGSRE